VAFAIAAGMQKRLRERSKQTEAQRKVPDESIAELKESGLFGIVTPKVFGGSELGFCTLFDTVVTVAAACPSTAWVLGVVAGHSWLVNLFPEGAQHDVMANPDALTATLFRLSGTATQVDGGYRLAEGVGRFASGIDHAEWLVVGSQLRGADGNDEPYFFILHRDDFRIVDDWDVVGMRGTGSKSVIVEDAFVPAHRAVSLKDMLAGTTPGGRLHGKPLYRLPFSYVAPFSIVGAPIGAALGVVEEFRGMMEARLANSEPLELADAGDYLSRLAASAAAIDSAIALVRESARRIDTIEDPGDLAPLEGHRIQRNWAYAVQTARQAANSLFEVAGGSQIYDSSRLQAYWRDTNAGAQHFAFSWGNATKQYGLSMIGRDKGGFALKPSTTS
jgi:3-hydroxy-9,10-secoandrosta-1,3,5(10)-triene-9,17-dione monooxygenase